MNPCGSEIVYSTMIDGERVQFGTSDFLYRSNKLMFDRKTETLWHQFRGVPTVGRWWAAVWNWKPCP